MIPALHRALVVALRAKGVPFPCEYAPTPVPATTGATRIQVQRDIDAGDTVAPGRARIGNPRMVGVRATAGIVRIFAKATVDHATRGDHEDLADRIVDAVHAEIHKIVRGWMTVWRVTRAGFVTDVAVPDGWAGVVYELRFTVDRAVNDVSWVGDAAGEYVMAADTTVTTLDTSDSPGMATGLPGAETRIQ